MDRTKPQPLSSHALARALLLGSGIALQGCAAAIVPPYIMGAIISAPLVGGVITEQKADIEMEAGSVSPEARSTLAAANRLVFIGDDPTLAYAGEELEKSGHFSVALVRENSRTMTPSERQIALGKACRSKNAHVALIAAAQPGRTSGGTGKFLANAAIGRAVTELPVAIDLRRCRDGWSHTMRGTLKGQTGIYNWSNTDDKISATAGAAIAEKVLELAGKSGPNQLAARNSATPVGSTSPAWNANGFSRQDIREAQRLLTSLGHEAGTPDGLLGPKTSAAIASFQRTAGISATGVLDTQTLDSLRQAAPTEGEAENFPVAEETIPGNEAKAVGQLRTVTSASNVATIAPVRVGYALVETELKASADPFSSTLAKIGKGRELKVLKDNGDWLHIQHDGREGYVFSEFISR